MDKKLVFTHPHDLRKLHTELLAAFPAWVETRPDGMKEARASVSGDGVVVVLWVPADTDAASVSAVVDAHSPIPPFAAPVSLLGQAIDLALSSTGVQLESKAVLREWRKLL